MDNLVKAVALEVADKFVIGADAETISEFATAFLAELSKRAEAVAVYEVGGYYKQLDGNWIQLVGVANEGKEYETMYCKDEIHRYTRQRGGLGRVTGTDHNYTYPLNIPPIFTFPPIHGIEAIENRVAEACAKAAESDREPAMNWCSSAIPGKFIADELRSGKWRNFK